MQCVKWYHEFLCHPGEQRTLETIRQHLYWKNLPKDVKKVCKACPTCQMTKRKTIKYGKLPVKEVESKPWEKLCVDLIGPYKIKSNKEKYKDKKGKMKPKDFRYQSVPLHCQNVAFPYPFLQVS